MTQIYCDLCGKALERSESTNKIIVNEFRADACEKCARKLIDYLRSGPNKGGQK